MALFHEEVRAVIGFLTAEEFKIDCIDIILIKGRSILH